MATTKKPGSGSGNRKNDVSSLLTIEVPPGEPTADKKREPPGERMGLPADLIDFDNEKLREGWQKIIDSQRKHVETDVLKITPPRAKLDPIAREALDKLAAKLIDIAPALKDSERWSTPAAVEKYVRSFITRKGLASEVKKVTDRLNARRITDGRRWVLTATYNLMLLKLFHQQQGNELEELMKDDLGVAERIMLDLEAKGGPLDVYTRLIVRSIMKRNRIHPSNTVLELVSQKVRAAI